MVSQGASWPCRLQMIAPRIRAIKASASIREGLPSGMPSISLHLSEKSDASAVLASQPSDGGVKQRPWRILRRFQLADKAKTKARGVRTKAERQLIDFVLFWLGLCSVAAPVPLRVPVVHSSGPGAHIVFSRRAHGPD